jgi:hypothetical protein
MMTGTSEAGSRSAGKELLGAVRRRVSGAGLWFEIEGFRSVRGGFMASGMEVYPAV